MSAARSIFEILPLDVMKLILNTESSGLSVQIFSSVYQFPMQYRILFVRMQLQKKFNLKYIAILMLRIWSDNKLITAEIISQVFEYVSESPYFDPIRKLFMEQNSDIKNNSYSNAFQETLFCIALYTDQTASLKQLYPDIPDKLEKLLCYFLDKFNILADHYLIMKAFSGDQDTIEYIWYHCDRYCDRMEGKLYFPMRASIMYGGHIHSNKMLSIFKLYPIVSTQSFGHLLRCNHLEKVKSLLMKNPKQTQNIKKQLALRHVFSCRYDEYFPNLVQINLETFEYCLRICGGTTKEDFIHGKKKNIFAAEILEKYNDKIMNATCYFITI